MRPKSFADDATPSGNGVAARLLVRLGYLLAEPRYLTPPSARVRHGRSWRNIRMDTRPLLMALDEFTAPPVAVVLRGGPQLAVGNPSSTASMTRTGSCSVSPPTPPTSPLPSPRKRPRVVIRRPSDRARKKWLRANYWRTCAGACSGAPVESLPALIEELRGSTVEHK